MGIEPTSRVRRLTGFEDQGSHQTPFTSDAVNCSRIGDPAGLRRHGHVCLPILPTVHRSRSLRMLPVRIVTPEASRCSISGTTYFRDVPSKSLTSATVNSAG